MSDELELPPLPGMTGAAAATPPIPDPQPVVEAPPVASVVDDAPERGERRRRRSKSDGARRPAARAKPDTRPASGKRVSETRNVTRQALERGLEQTIQGVAIAVTILDEQDGAIIARGEPRLTAALMNVADTNPRFKKRLEELLEGGAYMQLAVAVGAIALPITMRHAGSLLPPQMRTAAAMMQMDGASAPDTVPPEWASPATSTERVPGVAYVDEHGPYTVDERGNVIPLELEPDGSIRGDAAS